MARWTQNLKRFRLKKFSEQEEKMENEKEIKTVIDSIISNVKKSWKEQEVFFHKKYTIRCKIAMGCYWISISIFGNHEIFSVRIKNRREKELIIKTFKELL